MRQSTPRLICSRIRLPEFHNKEESDVKLYQQSCWKLTSLIRNGSRGGRRKQSFQATLTDTMAGFREFQRQSLQQMRPNSFDQEDYDECEMAIKIFESMEVQKNTGFYWACIQAFKDERFWRKYFIVEPNILTMISYSFCKL
ncbi:unnamed protein product [Microthlaspi erraticum]|uniref:Uncharacterized protein n=1 Tax=Microthlaspi erraticum TaxID=1685480 RepID=A0A6D2J9R2_9BRAS|nr:unnamed protein product [Microthlaspi erraticum]